MLESARRRDHRSRARLGTSPSGTARQRSATTDSSFHERAMNGLNKNRCALTVLLSAKLRERIPASFTPRSSSRSHLKFTGKQMKTRVTRLYMLISPLSGYLLRGLTLRRIVPKHRFERRSAAPALFQWIMESRRSHRSTSDSEMVPDWSARWRPGDRLDVDSGRHERSDTIFEHKWLVPFS